MTDPSSPRRARFSGLIGLALVYASALLPGGSGIDDGSNRDDAPGRHRGSIEAGGARWSYLVHVPTCYDGQSPLPMILALHGSGGTGVGFLEDAGWAELADREGVIVVAPDGQPMRPSARPSRLSNPRVWRSGQHRGDRPRGALDDLAFFDALLTEVAGRWRVDPSRTFAVGHSNGGAMALRLAVERSEVFAAVASVAALCYVESPTPRHGVSTLTIFGGADPLLPTEGGLSVLPWEVRRTAEVLPSMRAFAEAMGAPKHAVVFEHDGDVHSFAYPPGPDGAVVAFTLIDRHGHPWPGGLPHPGEAMLLGPRNDAIDATEVIWRFLDDHPRARPGP